jgi:hypothetical protein
VKKVENEPRIMKKVADQTRRDEKIEKTELPKLEIQPIMEKVAGLRAGSGGERIEAGKRVGGVMTGSGPQMGEKLAGERPGDFIHIYYNLQ